MWVLMVASHPDQSRADSTVSPSCASRFSEFKRVGVPLGEQVVHFRRLLTKTSSTPLVSPVTKLLAAEINVT